MCVFALSGPAPVIANTRRVNLQCHGGVGTCLRRRTIAVVPRKVCCRAIEEGEKQETAPVDEVEDVTKKWGLEAGLWKAMTSDKKDEEQGGAAKAKELLAKYGSAYLITSISFAIVSFSICYVLVNAGVDVRSLFANFGVQVGDTGEKVGTAAIAYAAHKALSPIRFPPTVALTPVVANMLGKKAEEANEDGQDADVQGSPGDE